MSNPKLTPCLIVVFAVQVCALIGCHRSYYRRQADLEAQRLVSEKALDPRWSSADGRLDIDPQSRMFDPFSSDHAPIPPDDPTSHQLMQNVDDHPGYRHWHANGDIDQVENPAWRTYLPIDENGEVVLTLDRAFQLAAINSPLLQAQREILYLSALDVSLQRFGFESQLFAGFSKLFTAQGNVASGTGSSASILSSSLGVDGGGIDLNRFTATGATLAASLANTLIWNFSGPDTNANTSLLDFAIVQPLLQDAGRQRILEALTQSERNLLANVRQYERFRRGFYLSIATGRAPGAGPNLTGDFLAPPAGANAFPGGYLGLLQQQQLIRNAEFNLRLLEAALGQFRTFYIEDAINSLQVRQFESSVFIQQQNLLNQKVVYQNALDDFKQLLGLPPQLPIRIADPLLDQFKIISDDLSNRLVSIGQLRGQNGAIVDQLNEIRVSLEYEGDNLNDKQRSFVADTVESLGPVIDGAIEVARMIRENDIKEVAGDIERLDQVRGSRIQYLRKLRSEIAKGNVQSEVEPQVFSDQSIPDPEGLRRLLFDPDEQKELAQQSDDNDRDADGADENESPPSETAGAAEESGEFVQQTIFTKLKSLEKGLEKMAEQIKDFRDAADGVSANRLAEIVFVNFADLSPGLLTGLDGLILELSLLQAKARSNSIEIQPVELQSDQAFEVARCFRRDWMNARATLVDDWRQIEFVADQLEAQVDVVFSGEIGNVGDNPFNLSFDNGQLSAGLQVDAPIVRLAERNDYRAAQINYQQSRRAFYQFEDAISDNLRLIMRDIDRNRILFELNRRSIQVNIDAVELSRDTLIQPPRVGAQSGLGATTARDLSDAINGLNAVQDQYVLVWVTYELQRRNLDFDMGTMILDATGQWQDPGLIDTSIGQKTAAFFGIGLDCPTCHGVSSLPPPTPETNFDSLKDEEDEAAAGAPTNQWPERTPPPKPTVIELETEQTNDDSPSPGTPQLNAPERSNRRNRSPASPTPDRPPSKIDTPQPSDDIPLKSLPALPAGPRDGHDYR